MLHAVPPELAHVDSVTETQFFGFCIAEKSIHGFCYMWHHPNLRIVSGGLFVYQGHKRSLTHSELCDYRAFMNDGPLANDLHSYRLANGYGVEIIEPLKRQHVTYADAARDSSLDLTYDAVLPPVMFGDGTHFEQAVRAKGELILRGERHAVDCYSMRDRSWAKPRPEESVPAPGVSWMQAVFHDDFAFCCTAFDHGSSEPIAPMMMPDEKQLNGGWLHRDGKLGWLVGARKKAVRDKEGFLVSLDLEVTDEHGRTITAHGKPVASVGWNPWPNVFMPLVLVRWESEGAIAFGDVQEGVWGDHLNFLGR